MDLDNLKDTWQNLNVRVERLDEENRRTTEALRHHVAKSAQMRLADSYRRSAFLGIALPALAPACVKVLHMPVWVGVVYALFGLLMGVIALRAYKMTRTTNFTTLSVVDALREAVKLRRRQNFMTTVGILLGSAILGILYSYLENCAWAFVVGLVIGSIIGLRRQLKQRALIREIEDALRE